jgi:hypothetical protein
MATYINRPFGENYLHTHLWHVSQSPLRLRCVVIMGGDREKREFFCVENCKRLIYILVWNHLNIWKM